MLLSGSFRSTDLADCLATGVFIVLAVQISATVDVPLDQAFPIAGMGGFASSAVEDVYVRDQAERCRTKQR